MRVGYIRVSAVDQHTDRQLNGIQVDREFTDQASGKDVARPQLDDLRRIVRSLTDKGVRVEFITEQLPFTGDDSPMANLLLSVMGAFAEFERALIRERQAEGIAKAKDRGVYKGRKKSLNPDQVLALVDRAASGEAKTVLAKEFRISRETVYAYLRAAPT